MRVQLFVTAQGLGRQICGVAPVWAVRRREAEESSPPQLEGETLREPVMGGAWRRLFGERIGIPEEEHPTLGRREESHEER